MIDPDGRYCPECGANWQGGQIPVEYVAKGYYGHREPCQALQSWHDDYDQLVPCTCEPRYYSKLIGIELPYDDPHHYDGVSFWMCAACGARWDRWSGQLVKQGESHDG
jgi:hypothetical protein